MSIPSIVYKAHATGNDFVVYLDEDGMHEPTADEVRFARTVVGAYGFWHAT